MLLVVATTSAFGLWGRC